MPAHMVLQPQRWMGRSFHKAGYGSARVWHSSFHCQPLVIQPLGTVLLETVCALSCGSPPCSPVLSQGLESVGWNVVSLERRLKDILISLSLPPPPTPRCDPYQLRVPHGTVVLAACCRLSLRYVPTTVVVVPGQALPQCHSAQPCAGPLNLALKQPP